MNWRETILQTFTPQVARLTIIADPDGLLLEEVISQEIRQRGFDLVIYEDALRFRFLYESRYRSAWDAGEALELALVVPGDDQVVDALPFDWLAGARRLRFGLQSLFPNLHFRVVQALDRSLFDALHQAQAAHHPSRLSEQATGLQATCDFILRYVFEIAPEVINQPTDLLRMLLRRHYSRLLLSSSLETHLVQALSTKTVFQGWPLAQIIPDRQAFLAFLQERWPLYLHTLAQAGSDFIKEPAGDYPLTYAGPPALPFGHDDVRVYIDNLFVEGLLRPVEGIRSQAVERSWARIGIHIDRAAENIQRLERLAQVLEKEMPGIQHSHVDWSAFALRLAEFNHLWHHLSADEQKKNSARTLALQQKIDVNFQAWLKERYGNLATLSGTVMVHHIVRAVRAQLDQAGARAALIVVDGLALDQWVTLRSVLSEQRPLLEIEQKAAFAWLPSLTAVSRQAIFAGRAPIYFAGSIETTDKEEALWSQYWSDAGIPPTQCGYLRSLGKVASLTAVTDLLSGHNLRVLGLVVDKVDKIMHGMELGAAGMHNQIRQWADQGFMARLLDLLVEKGFSVFLTADHGNIEAAGCGKPGEGAAADVRGQRVRIYPNPDLRSATHIKYPESIAWPPVGLPPDTYPLFAPYRKAFIAPDDKTVAHGGSAIEEVIVPFIQISKRKL
jgi:hypothetical protein